jgi:hypothetical protein
MDQFPTDFAMGPITGPAVVRYIDQRLEWFNDQSGYRACFDTLPATVFKFSIWTQQALEVIGNTPEDLIKAGQRTVHGTMGFVTKESQLFEKSFMLLVYDRSNKRVANIYDLVFTEFSQEYTLDKQNIFEASFFARNMELLSEASS